MSLEELGRKRSKWVESNRENGFEDGIKRLLTDLYPDNAHFIYELLQNAEDPRASVARFTLSKSSVEFEHDGERLFNLPDVEAITSIGTSTKRDDPTTIGKFGVGFKAVFAYSNCPEIHSGDFHFRIDDLVVPQTIGVARLPLRARETRFILPFNNPKKPKDIAAPEVERGLRALGDNTLLFLSHIQKIEYLLPSGALGFLERQDLDDELVEIRAAQPGGQPVASRWMRFQKVVEVTAEDGKPKSCRIALAYKMEKSIDPKGNERWSIVPLEHGQVSIYFPAEKEVSGLRFHVHAPFASTVARDSVRDSDGNRQLRDHLSQLAAESLSIIRDRGFLTIDFLAVLPNPQDNLPPFYEPLRKAIVGAFKTEKLTPTKSGRHASSDDLYVGPSRIQDSIGDDDLSLLTQLDVPLWARNPPQENQREDRFIKSLGIDEWSWGELAKAFQKPHEYPFGTEEETENAEHKKRLEEWIASKEDSWLLRLYAMLGEASESHSEDVDVAGLAIIRVSTDAGDRHVFPSSAFFPAEEDVAAPPSGVNFVKVEAYDKGRSETNKKLARTFLQSAGVRIYNARAVVELKLAAYESSPPSTIEKVHFKDIKQFVALWRKSPAYASIFRDRTFLLGMSDSKLRWLKPSALCLDVPYMETGLADHKAIHGRDPLWSEYRAELTEGQTSDFIEFVKAIGVLFALKIEKAGTYQNPHSRELRQDWNKPGTRRTSSEIDDDYSIEDLDEYLNAGTVVASRLIWDALVQADPKTSTARFRPNQTYPTRQAESQLVYHLKHSAWIPGKDGQFHKPQGVSVEDLREDFPHDARNGLLAAIGFGENVKKRSEAYQARDQGAKGMGFSSAEQAEEVAKLINKEGVTLEDIRTLAARRKQALLPGESVSNPERRKKNVQANTADAPTKESVQRERSIQVDISEVTAQAKAYLRAKYQNAERQLICQCCRREMPFRLRSGEHYFEAVQFVEDAENRHFQNRLALCPNCAAMYKHTRDLDDSELRRRIAENTASDNAEIVEVTVRLAGVDHVLFFVGTHWFDLKVLFSVGR